MPRLTNAAGVVVNVDDQTASRLSAGWHPAGETPAKETAAAKRKREAEKADRRGEAGPE